MTTAADIERDDPTFVEDLARSREAVEVAARWLGSLGLPVIVHPTFVRPSADRMAEYADGGDLGIVQRVEVKRRSLAFTSADDYPFDTVFVDARHCFDRARPKPYAYLILNRDMSCAIRVDVRATIGSWQVVEGLDRSKGRDRAWYACPKSLVQFFGIGLSESVRSLSYGRGCSTAVGHD